MNIEEQHGEAGEACFLALIWNLFLSMKGEKVENALGENAAMSLDAMEQHMFSVLDTLASRFPPEAEARILKYQEIIDYLAFSLSHGRLYVEMPDVPVDLDVYLTQDSTADFSKNLITFGEEIFLILTLPAFLGVMEKTLRRIIEEMEHAHIPCRHVQRILFFVCVLCAVVLFFLFCVIGFYIVLAYIQFYASVLFSFTTFSLAELKHVRHFASNGISGVIACSLNLMFFCFFSAALQASLENITIPTLGTTSSVATASASKSSVGQTRHGRKHRYRNYYRHKHGCEFGDGHRRHIRSSL